MEPNDQKSIEMNRKWTQIALHQEGNFQSSNKEGG